jgi:hypothetical protein
MLGQVFTIMHHRPAAPNPTTITLMSSVARKPSRGYQMPTLTLRDYFQSPGHPDSCSGPYVSPLPAPRGKPGDRDSYPPGINMPRPEIFSKLQSRQIRENSYTPWVMRPRAARISNGFGVEGLSPSMQAPRIPLRKRCLLAGA